MLPLSVHVQENWEEVNHGPVWGGGGHAGREEVSQRSSCKQQDQKQADLGHWA